MRRPSLHLLALPLRCPLVCVAPVSTDQGPVTSPGPCIACDASVAPLVHDTLFSPFSRLGRLIRVVKNIKSLQVLFISLVKSLPSLASVGSLMLLLIFMYAVLGVQLFHGVSRGDFLTGDANFETLPNALITLFRCSTGESWNGVMHDLQSRPDGSSWLADLTGSAPSPTTCSPDGKGCGGWCAARPRPHARLQRLHRRRAS